MTKLAVAPLSLNDRVLERGAVESTDALYVLAHDAQGSELRFDVENIHAFGALLKLPKNLDLLPVGAKISGLRIMMGAAQIGEYGEAVVRHVSGARLQKQLGVFFDPPATNNSDPKKIGPVPADATPAEAREKGRLALNSAFLPIATAPHPIHYDEQLHFKVLDLSKGGAKLATSARNRLIFKGGKLNPLVISLPTVGNVQVVAKITFISPANQSGEMHLGIAFTKTCESFDKNIVKYLLSFSEIQNQDVISTLKSAGFKPKFLKSHIDYAFVHTPDEFQQVLKIRRQAYSRAGKVSEDQPIGSMSDIYDLNSKIIVAKYRGEIIGSVRVTFCENPQDKFELDDSIEIPKHIPRQDSVEISRLCVDNRFAGSDVVLGLIERCTILTAKSGTRFVITSCVADMLEYYKKLAFYPTGLEFTLTTLNNLPHFLLLHDTRSSQRAWKINPLYWHFAYRNVIEYLQGFGFSEPTKLSIWKKLVIKLGIAWMKKGKRRKL